MQWSFSFLIRKVASLSCAVALAWDYVRDPNFEDFSLWLLCIQFIYFQLPLKSKALPFLHTIAFIGATISPVMYGHQLLWKPQLETSKLESWNISWSTIVLRSFAIHIAPLIFHILDSTANQFTLVHSYERKSPKLMYIWTFASLITLGFAYEFSYPDAEDVGDLRGISTYEFLSRNKIASGLGFMFSFLVLYLLILRRAYK